jgi:hypothetical protein
MLTDGSGDELLYLLLGHAFRMPVDPSLCGDPCYSVGIPKLK